MLGTGIACSRLADVSACPPLIFSWSWSILPSPILELGVPRREGIGPMRFGHNTVRLQRRRESSLCCEYPVADLRPAKPNRRVFQVEPPRGLPSGPDSGQD